MGGVRHVKELTDIVVYNVLCVPGPLQTERKLSSSSRIVYCKHPLWQTVFMESCCDTRPCLHSYRGVVSLQSSWWRDVLGHSYFPPGSHGFEQQQERTKGWCTLVPGPSSPLSRGRSHGSEFWSAAGVAHQASSVDKAFKTPEPHTAAKCSMKA